MSRASNRAGMPAADQGRFRAARIRVVAYCFVAALAAPAAAERADRDKPVNLEADSVTIDDSKQIALFEGNVVLTQGTLQIRGDRMQVRQDQDGFRHGTTWGSPAHFRQKREGFDEYIEGWAERIEYDGRAESMQMFNGAQLKRGQDEVRGNYISYDAKSEFFKVTGAGTEAAASGSEGRVRAVIQPKSKDKPPAGAPVSLKPADSLTPPREETGTRRK